MVKYLQETWNTEHSAESNYDCRHKKNSNSRLFQFELQIFFFETIFFTFLAKRKWHEVYNSLFPDYILTKGYISNLNPLDLRLKNGGDVIMTDTISSPDLSVNVDHLPNLCKRPWFWFNRCVSFAIGPLSTSKEKWLFPPIVHKFSVTNPGVLWMLKHNTSVGSGASLQIGRQEGGWDLFLMSIGQKMMASSPEKTYFRWHLYRGRLHHLSFLSRSQFNYCTIDWIWLISAVCINHKSNLARTCLCSFNEQPETETETERDKLIFQLISGYTTFQITKQITKVASGPLAKCQLKWR